MQQNEFLSASFKILSRVGGFRIETMVRNSSSAAASGSAILESDIVHVGQSHRTKRSRGARGRFRTG